MIRKSLLLFVIPLLFSCTSSRTVIFRRNLTRVESISQENMYCYNSLVGYLKVDSCKGTQCFYHKNSHDYTYNPCEVIITHEN